VIVCTNCGHQNHEGATFCANPECGVYLEWHGERGQQAPAPPQARPPEEARPVAQKLKQTGQRRGVSLLVDQDALSADPGGAASTGVRVRNTGEIVEEFDLKIGGPAGSWAEVQPARLSLFPSTEGSAEAHFKPPRSHTVPAGSYRFEVEAISTVNPNVRAQAGGTVEVGPFVELAGEMSPRNAESRRSTRHRVNVANKGNASTRVSVTANDPDEALSFTISPNELQPGPGQQAVATVRAQARRRLRKGAPVRHPFTVRAEAEGQQPMTWDGTLVQIPTTIPKWAPKAVVLGVVLLGFLFLLPTCIAGVRNLAGRFEIPPFVQGEEDRGAGQDVQPPPPQATQPPPDAGERPAANTPPEVVIEEPGDGDTFALDDVIRLSGRSDDAESGRLRDNQVGWFLDEQLIARGHAPGAVRAADLGPGTFELTFAASDGQEVSQETVTITVLPAETEPAPDEIQS
jgi:hypothetical protein